MMSTKFCEQNLLGQDGALFTACRQRTVRIECCEKSAALSLFGSCFSAAAARTDTALETIQPSGQQVNTQQSIYIIERGTTYKNLRQAVC